MSLSGVVRYAKAVYDWSKIEIADPGQLHYENKALEKELEDARANAEGAEAEAAEAKRHVELVEAQLGDAKRELQAALQTCNAFRGRVAAAEASVRTLTGQLAAAKQELLTEQRAAEQARREATTANAGVVAARERAAAAEASVRALTEQLNATQQAIGREREAAEQARQQATTANQNAAAAQERARALTEQLNEAQLTIAGARGAVDEANQNAMAANLRADAAEAFVLDLVEQQKVALAAAESATAEQREASRLLKEAEGRAARAETELADAKRELQALRGALEELRTRASAVEAERQAEQRALLEARDAARRALQETAEARRHAAESQAEAAEEKERADLAESGLNQVFEELRNLEEEKDEELERIQQSLREAERQLEAARKSLQTARDTAAKTAAELREVQAAAHADADAQRKLKEDKETAEKRADAVEREMQELRAQLERLRTARDSAAAQVAARASASASPASRASTSSGRGSRSSSSWDGERSPSSSISGAGSASESQRETEDEDEEDEEDEEEEEEEGSEQHGEKRKSSERSGAEHGFSPSPQRHSQRRRSAVRSSPKASESDANGDDEAAIAPGGPALQEKLPRILRSPIDLDEEDSEEEDDDGASTPRRSAAPSSSEAAESSESENDEGESDGNASRRADARPSADDDEVPQHLEPGHGDGEGAPEAAAQPPAGSRRATGAAAADDEEGELEGDKEGDEAAAGGGGGDAEGAAGLDAGAVSALAALESLKNQAAAHLSKAKAAAVAAEMAAGKAEGASSAEEAAAAAAEAAAEEAKAKAALEAAKPLAAAAIEAGNAVEAAGAAAVAAVGDLDKEVNWVAGCAAEAAQALDAACKAAERALAAAEVRKALRPSAPPRSSSPPAASLQPKPLDSRAVEAEQGQGAGDGEHEEGAVDPVADASGRRAPRRPEDEVEEGYDGEEEGHDDEQQRSKRKLSARSPQQETHEEPRRPRRASAESPAPPAALRSSHGGPAFSDEEISPPSSRRESPVIGEGGSGGQHAEEHAEKQGHVEIGGQDDMPVDLGAGFEADEEGAPPAPADEQPAVLPEAPAPAAGSEAEVAPARSSRPGLRSSQRSHRETSSDQHRETEEDNEQEAFPLQRRANKRVQVRTSAKAGPSSSRVALANVTNTLVAARPASPSQPLEARKAPGRRRVRADAEIAHQDVEAPGLRRSARTRGQQQNAAPASLAIAKDSGRKVVLQDATNLMPVNQKMSLDNHVEARSLYLRETLNRKLAANAEAHSSSAEEAGARGGAGGDALKCKNELAVIKRCLKAAVDADPIADRIALANLSASFAAPSIHRLRDEDGPASEQLLSKMKSGQRPIIVVPVSCGGETVSHVLVSSAETLESMHSALGGHESDFLEYYHKSLGQPTRAGPPELHVVFKDPEGFLCAKIYRPRPAAGEEEDPELSRPWLRLVDGLLQEARDSGRLRDFVLQSRFEGYPGVPMPDPQPELEPSTAVYKLLLERGSKRSLSCSEALLLLQKISSVLWENGHMHAVLGAMASYFGGDSMEKLFAPLRRAASSMADPEKRREASELFSSYAGIFGSSLSEALARWFDSCPLSPGLDGTGKEAFARVCVCVELLTYVVAGWDVNEEEGDASAGVPVRAELHTLSRALALILSGWGFIDHKSLNDVDVSYLKRICVIGECERRRMIAYDPSTATLLDYALKAWGIHIQRIIHESGDVQILIKLTTA